MADTNPEDARTTRVTDEGRGMLVEGELDREEREAVGDALADDLRELRETNWAVE